jgi:hypothetical protein
MDRRSVLLKIHDQLKSSFENAKASVSFEKDVVSIVVISNSFKDVIITRRIDMVTHSILDLSMKELVDFNISIIALTENEELFDLCENVNSSMIVSNGEGFAAESTY